MAKPSEQYQGAPVGFAGRSAAGGFMRSGGYLMVAEKPEQYLDVPLYTHVDPGEVERLRAQLAERDALLRDTKRCIERNDYPVFELLKRIDATLSASAEPSAPVEIDERPEGCCCPPKGYNGLWAAGPCPGHQGLRKLGQARASLERRP